MTIKQNIDLINETINSSYNQLQSLVYEEEVEKFVRLKLLDITNISKDLLEFICSKKIQQKKVYKRGK